MNKKIIKISLLLCISLIILFTTTVGSFGRALQGYYISQYDVKVDILNDGSLDITEQVNFSFLGNSNNAVLLIDKQEDEEIEIKSVYTFSKDEWVECERLADGQWGANVFNGTYSEIEESNLLRLKIYGIFKKQQGEILVRYRVKNAIKRYEDIAVYNRNHVKKYWEGYISNLNIEITLPGKIATNEIRPYLHGLLIGQKQVTKTGIIYYSIPNTVPGEYVEARVTFPEYLVNNAPKVSEEPYLNTVLEEEEAYLQSDKSDLLRAREKAAKEEGRRVSNEKQRENFQQLSVIISLLASFLGILTIYRTKKALFEVDEQNSFENPVNNEIGPAEACLLLQGKTGIRGILGGLLQLSSKGFVDVFINDNDICFLVNENCDVGVLKPSERKLISFVVSLINEEGYFCPSRFKNTPRSPEDYTRLKKLYNKWDRSIHREYTQKNQLTEEQQYYRNLGLIMGVILFAAGCILPVAASIWSGYLMILVGFLLFNYALSIEKRTIYSISKTDDLKTVKELFEDGGQNIESLPDWASDTQLVLGFAIALETENELLLLKEFAKDKNDSFSNQLKDIEVESLESILKDTLISADVFFSEKIDI